MIHQRYTIKEEVQRDDTHTLYKAYDEIFKRTVMLFECTDTFHFSQNVKKIFDEDNIFYYYTAFIEDQKAYYVIGNFEHLQCVKTHKFDDRFVLMLYDAYIMLITKYNHKGIYFKSVPMEWLFSDENSRVSLMLPGANLNNERREESFGPFFLELYAILSKQKYISNEGLDYIKDHYNEQVFDLFMRHL